MVATIALSVLPRAARSAGTVVLQENWEFGIGAWLVDPGSAWEVGSPSNTPDSAYEGNNCAGTILAGNYPENSAGRIWKQNIVLPPVDEASGERLTLEFFQWTICHSGSDFGRVEVDTGGVGGWFPLPASGPGQTHYLDGAIWSATRVDLTSLEGKTIGLGFYFRSVDTVFGTLDVNRGWYVDDIAITSGPIPPFPVAEGFEEGRGDWWATDGVWEVGTPTAGPGGAYRGQNCMCTLLNENYRETMDTWLISPPVKIPDLGTGEPLGFRYQTWYKSHSTSDLLRLHVSVNGGPWTAIGVPLSVDSFGWVRPSVSLPDYADSTIQFAFQARAVDTVFGTLDVNFGWCIDQLYFEGLTLWAPDPFPVPGSVGVPADEEIQVTFNGPIDPATVNASSFDVSGSISGDVPCTFEFSPDNLTFKCTPDSPFAYGETVTCRITDAILDAHDLAFDGDGDLQPGGDFEWSFTVEGSGIFGTVSLSADGSVKVPGVVMDLEPGGEDVTSSVGTYGFPSLAPGNYTVTPSKVGDLGNQPSGSDASLAARAALGVIELDDLESCAADVSGNGEVSPFDASLIARRRVGLITSWPSGRDWCFAPESRAYLPLNAGSVTEDYAAALAGDVDGDWEPLSPLLSEQGEGVVATTTDSEGRAWIRNDLPEPAWGLDFTVESDLPVSSIGLPEGSPWTVVVGPEDSGARRVVAYGTSSVAPGRQLALLDFAGTGVVFAKVTSLRINETYRPDLEIGGGQTTSLPTAFALYAPRSNPLTGDVGALEVRFALPVASKAAVDVYDVRGARLAQRTFAELPAGEHAVSIPIERFASGVYFYRLEAGDFRATRKVVVAR